MSDLTNDEFFDELEGLGGFLPTEEARRLQDLGFVGSYIRHVKTGHVDTLTWVRGESSESLGIKTPKGKWIVINDETEFELLRILTVGELMELLQQCDPSSHVALSLLDGNKDWIWVGTLSEQPPWFNQGEERFGEISLYGYYMDDYETQEDPL